jgi:hypothetical protein
MATRTYLLLSETLASQGIAQVSLGRQGDRGKTGAKFSQEIYENSYFRRGFLTGSTVCPQAFRRFPQVNRFTLDFALPCGYPPEALFPSDPQGFCNPM